jgi:predicted SAM-dependent methyltransferase
VDCSQADALIQDLIHLFTELLAQRRPRRRYRIDARPAMVNLGSGLIVAPHWINVDSGLYSPLRYLPAPVLSYLHGVSGWTSILSQDRYVSALKNHRFIQHDVRLSLPFDNDSVDFLFASHLLDMINQSDGARLIEEAHRVLKPGGFIRLSVADFDRNIELYYSGAKQEALARFFRNSKSPRDRRYYMYDYETLASTLSAAGFVEIRRCPYREGVVPDLEFLDNRPEESLFVEAMKP